MYKQRTRKSKPKTTDQTHGPSWLFDLLYILDDLATSLSRSDDLSGLASCSSPLTSCVNVFISHLSDSVKFVKLSFRQLVSGLEQLAGGLISHVVLSKSNDHQSNHQLTYFHGRLTCVAMK